MSTSTSPSTSTKPLSSSLSEPQPKNQSLLAIPAAYALAYPPYLYQFYRGMTASSFTATNIAPRTNLDILRGKIPTATYNSLVRARGAHLNALEGFPLFAAAMLAGNQMNLPAKDMNWAAGTYLATRVVYTALYMTTTSEMFSYARSGVYTLSVAVPFWVLWKAGVKARDEGFGKMAL